VFLAEDHVETSERLRKLLGTEFDVLVEAGLAAGALGYILRDMAGDDLVAAVHAALDGRRYVRRALR
jgi:hypothetical protein